jgi:two-component system chemotaxis response regulator CheB
MKPVRVMIVDDSPTVRLGLESLIARDPRCCVAATAASGEQALAMLDRIQPDVLTMDILMPGLDGVQTTQAVMVRRPTPIVIVSSTIDDTEPQIAMNALRAGALAAVEKPVLTGPGAEEQGRRLCATLLAMSQVRVIRQNSRRQATLAPVGHHRPTPAAPAGLPLTPTPPATDSVVGIVASTGGPPALVRLFEILGPRFPLPILLVQHISPGFLDGFARWLAETTRFRVAIARGGESPQPGLIHLPPQDHHLRLRGQRLAIDQGAPVCSQRPSGTVLLASLAESMGSRAVGVVLTGMGEDGADGCRHIAAAGGYTLAEDASTAVVFGMPGAAVQRGAVAELLPLEALARRLAALGKTVPASPPP